MSLPFIPYSHPPTTQFSSFSPTDTGSPALSEAAVLSASKDFLDGIVGFGIPAENTTQTGFSVVPHYALSNDTTPVLIITGWDATNHFMTMSTTDLASNISSLAVELGGSVNSVAFIASEPSRRAAYNQALTLSAMDAMDRANAMVSGLGATVGSPMYITDTGRNVEPNSIYAFRALSKGVGESSGFSEMGLILVEANVDAAFTLIPSQKISVGNNGT